RRVECGVFPCRLASIQIGIRWGRHFFRYLWLPHWWNYPSRGDRRSVRFREFLRAPRTPDTSGSHSRSPHNLPAGLVLVGCQGILLRWRDRDLKHSCDLELQLLAPAGLFCGRVAAETASHDLVVRRRRAVLPVVSVDDHWDLAMRPRSTDD